MDEFEARAGAYISQHQMLQKGDTVIVVTTADRFINDLNDILDEEKGLL